MKAKTLLELTAGQHALQAALCAKLEETIEDRDRAQESARHVERCLREIATQVLPVNPAIMPNEPMWPSRVAQQTIVCVQGLQEKIAGLEADLSAACAKVRQ